MRYIKNRFRASFICFFLSLIVLAFSACSGSDNMPDYFGLLSGDSAEPPPPKEKPDVAPLSEVTISKLMIGEDGRQIEGPIPSGKILEVGTGTFIARDETDLGEKFSATAKFKILNSGETNISFTLPPQAGPFYITSGGNLKQSLSSEQFIIISIAFKPTAENTSGEGKIEEEIEINGETYKLAGVALKPSGLATTNILDEYGTLILKDATYLTFPEIALSSQIRRQYFMCDKVLCDNELQNTNCKPCLNIMDGRCELLQVNIEDKPVGAVDKKCNAATSDKTPASEINLTSTDLSTKKVQKKVLEIINTGIEPLIIESVKIKDLGDSKSRNQFSVNNKALYAADSFQEVELNILQGFDAENTREAEAFPIVIPPYDPPLLTTRLFMVVSYHPNDIMGSDGVPASVGSSAKDEARLEIVSENYTKTLSLTGTTTIREVPALQVYTKSSTGIRPITNNSTYPLKGITHDTYNLGVPLFMKLSDSSTTPLRISSIIIKGENFEWLDTQSKLNEKPEDSRCTLPVYDNGGSQIDVIDNLDPVSLNPKGFVLEPGVYTTDTMPFFGCLNFTRNPDNELETVTFKGDMTITAQELTPSGEPALNPDGTIKETSFTFELLGVIDPIKGPQVYRIVQTMALVLNPQFPSISSAASDDEWEIYIKEGRATEYDKDLFMMSALLDPFDEDDDGITVTVAPIETRAIPKTYDDPTLKDYTNITHNSLLSEGEMGIFDGFPNLPDDLMTNGLKVYTASLSYPGPLAQREDIPYSPSECEDIDPCTAEGQKKLGEGNNDPNYKGVCAYFHVTSGKSSSPAFHYPTEDPPGNRRGMCEKREEPYELHGFTGRYTLDGKIEFDDVGMLFQGPTYFHNPSGPLGPVSPLDEYFPMTFTTEVLLPFSETRDIDRLPDKRIDVSKGEYKINLNDPYSNLPPICENNLKNRYINGESYSSWRYIAPLLTKDKEGLIPAGCPEEDNNFIGGIAFLRGQRLDQKTGHTAFVATAKFSSSENLTFAFKDVMLFIVFNGWFCDPAGPEEDMEGVHCFDKAFNYRDNLVPYSIINY